MPIIAKEPESTFSPAPEGLHQAVCCDVVELEAEVNKFTGQLQNKVRIVWEIDTIDEKAGRPFEVSQRYTNSLHEKAKLRIHLEAWRGRRFTDEELKGFDLEKLIGANCQIQVAQKVSDNGKTYANIQAIVPIGKNTPKISVSIHFIRAVHRRKDAPVQTTIDDEVPF